MGARHYNYARTRSWVCKLVIRSLALCGSLGSIAVLVLTNEMVFFPILAAVVTTWCLIDLILLSIRCIPQFIVAAVFDIISGFILLASACFILITWSDFRPDFYNWTWPIIIGSVMIITAVLFFVLFALSVKEHRNARAHPDPHYLKTWRPHSAWRPDSSQFGSEAESMMPIQYGVVNKSIAPSTVGASSTTGAPTPSSNF